MQTEPFGLVAVEFITNDGTTETIGVGTVHTQLVGAAGVGIEGEESPPVSGIKHLIFRHSRFAMAVVHHLARTVDGVAEQGQGDATFGLLHHSLHEGDIAFLDGALHELFL